MPLSFSKYCGSGNDFVIFDGRSLSPASLSIQTICNRRYGIGADGVLLLTNSAIADFGMRIFNPDGTEAEMCGNGIRCVAAFAKKLNLISSSCTISTIAGIHHCEVDKSFVSVRFPKPGPISQIHIDSHLFYTVNTGVPHAITESCPENFLEFAPPLRSHPAFGKNGTNISAIKYTKNGISLRTFERGVQEETLACGTAALATGVIAEFLGYGTHHKVTVQSKEQLEIVIKPTFILQKGSSYHVFDGMLPTFQPSS